MTKEIAKQKLPVLFWVLVGYLIISYIPCVFGRSVLVKLTKEDGVYETIGAMGFMVTAILFFILYYRSQDGNDLLFFQTKKNLFYLLLAILFVFVFGEEISWGQRIFDIGTPDYFKDNNIQDETNLHNLKLFNSVDEENIKRPWWDIFSMSRLFKIFWFLFCFAVPLLNKLSTKFSLLVRFVNLPLIPLWVGIFFPLNYLVSKLMEIMVSTNAGIVEMEECNHAIFFAVSAYVIYQQSNTRISPKKLDLA